MFHLKTLLLSSMLLVASAVAAPPSDDEMKALVARIDRHIEARWKTEKVQPAAAVEDHVFLRRVHLDLVGSIPSISTTRDFLDDPDPDKRRRLVDRLLASEAHSHHFAILIRRQLLPGTFAAPTSPLDVWLQKRIKENVPYDRTARDIVTAGLPLNADAGLGTIYQAAEYKPENLAANVSRVFLGIRLECAQCHDHPFASWKQRQFWELAAFFSGVKREGAAEKAPRAGRIGIPDSKTTVQARLLGMPEQPLKEGVDPRTVLADWIGKPDNPYFARAVVNRTWAHFHGTGIVEPLDEMGEENVPSHPELLADLSKSFVDSGYDMRRLIRAIVSGRAYQLSSAFGAKDEVDPRLFSRMPVRGLSADQILDSLAQATWKSAAERGPTEPFGSRQQFLARFAGQDRPTETRTSILQALHLMNGKAMADAVDPARNRALRILVEAKGMTTPQRIEELYLNTLSRRPRPEELARLVKHVEGGGPMRNERQALSDVLWALLNSPEFLLNQ